MICLPHSSLILRILIAITIVLNKLIFKTMSKIPIFRIEILLFFFAQLIRLCGYKGVTSMCSTLKLCASFVMKHDRIFSRCIRCFIAYYLARRNYTLSYMSTPQIVFTPTKQLWLKFIEEQHMYRLFPYAHTIYNNYLYINYRCQ